MCVCVCFPLTMTSRIFMKQLKHSFSPVAHFSGKMLHILCHAVIASEETNLWKCKRKIFTVSCDYGWCDAYRSRMRMNVSLWVKVCVLCMCSGKSCAQIQPHRATSKAHEQKLFQSKKKNLFYWNRSKCNLLYVWAEIWFCCSLKFHSLIIIKYCVCFHELIWLNWLDDSSLVIRCSVFTD